MWLLSAVCPDGASVGRSPPEVTLRILPPDPPPWGNRLRRFPYTPSWGFFPSTEEPLRAPDTADQDPNRDPPSTDQTPNPYPMQ